MISLISGNESDISVSLRERCVIFVMQVLNIIIMVFIPRSLKSFY